MVPADGHLSTKIRNEFLGSEGEFVVWHVNVMPMN